MREVRADALPRVRWNLRQNAGATLLELVCALFIVTTALFGLLQMYTVAFDKSKAVNEYAIAARAINNEMETLRAQPFAALAAGEGLAFVSETPALERLLQAEGEVRIVDRSEGTLGLREISVRVRWRGENGRLIEKQAVTLIANRE